LINIGEGDNFEVIFLG